MADRFPSQSLTLPVTDEDINCVLLSEFRRQHAHTETRTGRMERTTEEMWLAQRWWRGRAGDLQCIWSNREWVGVLWAFCLYSLCRRPPSPSDSEQFQGSTEENTLTEKYPGFRNKHLWWFLFNILMTLAKKANHFPYSPTPSLPINKLYVVKYPFHFNCEHYTELNVTYFFLLMVPAIKCGITEEEYGSEVHFLHE